MEEIVDFIAQDSIDRALHFYDELIAKIKEIPNNPYIYRQRISLNDKNIRELIFKGYTVPFLIDKDENKIVILGIFNQNLWQ